MKINTCVTSHLIWGCYDWAIQADRLLCAGIRISWAINTHLLENPVTKFITREALETGHSS